MRRQVLAALAGAVCLTCLGCGSNAGAGSPAPTASAESAVLNNPKASDAVKAQAAQQGQMGQRQQQMMQQVHGSAPTGPPK